jgi:hypothetical protein
MSQAPRPGYWLIKPGHIALPSNASVCIINRVLLHFQDKKFLPVCDGAGNICGQIPVAVKVPNRVGRPLAQRQAEVGAL